MTTLGNCKVLGWYRWEDVYKFSNNISSAVYAFGIFNRLPKEKRLPIDMPNVVYFGETGGQEKIFDKKHENGKGRLETSFHRRMKEHVCRDKIKLIREEMLTAENFIGIWIAIPKNHMESNFVKTWLKASESELISCYSCIHGSPPRYNEAHKTNNTKINAESFSQTKVKEINRASLENYI